MTKNNLFVIDTNILISAFILPHSISRKALNKARKEGYVAISQQSADEFTEVFIYYRRPGFISIKSFSGYPNNDIGSIFGGYGYTKDFPVEKY